MAMVLTVMCAIVALFCVIALGFGPWLFAAIGAAGFFIGFRARRRRWWGLALGAGGLALSLGALAGWRWKTVVLTVVVVFALVTAARVAGRSVVSTPGSR